MGEPVASGRAVSSDSRSLKYIQTLFKINRRFSTAETGGYSSWCPRGSGTGGHMPLGPAPHATALRLLQVSAGEVGRGASLSSGTRVKEQGTSTFFICTWSHGFHLGRVRSLLSNKASVTEGCPCNHPSPGTGSGSPPPPRHAHWPSDPHTGCGQPRSSPAPSHSVTKESPQGPKQLSAQPDAGELGPGCLGASGLSHRPRILTAVQGAAGAPSLLHGTLFEMLKSGADFLPQLPRQDPWGPT